jgi:hypothetical protein
MTAEGYVPMVRAALRLRHRLTEEGRHSEATKAVFDLLGRFGVSGEEFTRSYCLLTAASALLRDRSSRDLADVVMRSALPESARPCDGSAEPVAHAWSADPAIDALAKACDAFDRGEPPPRIGQTLGLHLSECSARVANERWRANNLYRDLLGELAPRPKSASTAAKKAKRRRSGAKP